MYDALHDMKRVFNNTKSHYATEVKMHMSFDVEPSSNTIRSEMDVCSTQSSDLFSFSGFSGSFPQREFKEEYPYFDFIESDTAIQEETVETMTPVVDNIIHKKNKIKIQSEKHLGENKIQKKLTSKRLKIRPLREHSIAVVRPQESSMEEIMQESTHHCRLCDKHFRFKYDLNIHVFESHCDARPYPCKFCHKRFTGHSSMLAHMRIHTGERPFTCLKCDRKFIQRSHMRDHERTHSSHREFKCTECEAAFTRMSALRRHELVHRDETRYACIKCDKKFNRRHELLLHETRNVCKMSVSSKSSLKSEKVDRVSHNQSSAKKALLSNLTDDCPEIEELKVAKKRGRGRPRRVNTVAESIVHQRTTIKLKLFSKRLKIATKADSKKFKRSKKGVSQNTCDDFNNVIGVLQKAEQYIVHVSECSPQVSSYDTSCLCSTLSCKECSEIFTNVDTLNAHRLSLHSPLSPLQFSCGLCEERFKTLDESIVCFYRH